MKLQNLMAAGWAACAALTALPAAAEEVMPPEVFKQQTAALIALKDLCVSEHPKMKSMIENKWKQSFDEGTFKRMASLQASPEFSALLSDVKTEALKNKRENLAECESMYGISAKKPIQK